jgi:hypothetical protein
MKYKIVRSALPFCLFTGISGFFLPRRGAPLERPGSAEPGLEAVGLDNGTFPYNLIIGIYLL